MANIERITEAFPDETFLQLDGLDDAILGVEENGSRRLIYSVSKIIDCLIAQDMTDEEAFDYYGYNIACLYIGEQTPILCDDLNY